MRPPHKKTDRRRWAGAAHHRVLKKLNQQPESASSMRVVEFLQRLKEAETLRIELYKAEQAGNRWRVETNYSGDPFGPEEYDELHNKVPEQKRLRECLVHIERHLERLRWQPAIRSCAGFNYLSDTHTWANDTGDQWENWATLLLLRQLKGSGMSPAPILRFRQCRECSAWFYALTDHQESCGTACRKRFHLRSRDPERHALNMRTLRQRKKEQEQRHDEAVERAWKQIRER